MLSRLSLVVLVALFASASAQQCQQWCVRKEIRTLSQEELFNFTSALLQLNQKSGNYYNERYPITHFNFVGSPPIGGPVHDTNFLPWHRYFLRQLEMDLQVINPSICLPYWNWTLDTAVPADSPVFKSQYFGTGTSAPLSGGSGECVHDGPFTFENGWQIPDFTPTLKNYCSPNYGLNFSCEEFPGTTCLKRGYFGVPTATTTAGPTTTQSYTSDYSSDTTTPAAAAKEGNVFIGIPNGHNCIGRSTAYVPTYESVHNIINTNGTYMLWSMNLFCTIHNAVHRFINGQMATNLSPSDPIFYLHHGYLDVIFTQWQNKWHVPYGGNTYLNNVLVPVNRTDILYPFGASDEVPLNASPITVDYAWDIQNLCYEYQY